MPELSLSVELESVLKALNKNRFEARMASTSVEANKIILDMIPVTASIGIGDSTTLRQIGILDELGRRGNSLINPFVQDLLEKRREDPSARGLFLERARAALRNDVFLTSCNAVTEDGKIVAIDGAGNRIAGIIYGARKVILPVGRNKLVKNVSEAVYRIKNVIAPVHAQWKKRKTPCAVSGKCSDCDSPERICNIIMILEKKSLHNDLSVILINEDLGLGWDPAWDDRRISEIKSRYYQHCPPF